MSRIEEEEFYDEDMDIRQSVYWADIMIQREEYTRMRREDHVRKGRQTRHEVKRQMIILRRALKDPDTIDLNMTDNRRDVEEHYQIPLHISTTEEIILKQYLGRTEYIMREEITINEE